jgi:hypothetical protein
VSIDNYIKMEAVNGCFFGHLDGNLDRKVRRENRGGLLFAGSALHNRKISLN